MSSVHVIFGIIAAIGVAGIALAIVNWVYLAAASSKIAFVESEIQKKASEFDTLRKELQQRSDANASHGMAAAQSQADEASSDEIAIVRSVRGSYDHPGEAGRFEQTVVEMHPHERAGQSPPAAATGNDTITISLFSDAKKDADFLAAWKQLTHTLPGRDRPRVALDLRHIMFFYEKEIQYIERMLESVARCQGTMMIVNCADELRALLLKHPALARCLEE